MIYCISGIKGNLDRLKLLLTRIEQVDTKAQFIFIGNIGSFDLSWEVLEWFTKNVTPMGKYQAIQNLESYSVIMYYYGKSLPENLLNTNSILKYVSTLSKDELRELVQFYESLPLVKEINIERTSFPYYVVNAWLNSSVIKLLKQDILTAKQRDYCVQHCMFGKVPEACYSDTAHYNIIMPHKTKSFSKRNVIALADNDTIQCYCVDKNKFL